MLSKINEIYIEVTDKCNLNCSYCYFVEKNSTKFNKGKDNAFSSLKFAINNTKENNLKVVFHGAEPLHEDHNWFLYECKSIKKLCEDKSKSVVFQIQTNGTLLNDNYIKVFVEFDFKVNVSLDGTAEIHNTSRGQYEKTIQAIKKLQEHNLINSIIVAISQHNYNKVNEVVNHLITLGIKSYHFNLASIVNNNKSLKLNSDQIFEYYKSSFEVLIANYKIIKDWRLVHKLKRFTDDPLINKNAFILGCDSPICHAGVHMILVRPNGDYYPCGSCVSNADSINRFKLGNLNEPFSNDEYENKLLDFHNIYFNQLERCNDCGASVVCEFSCPAFDIYDTDTAINRCTANKLFYKYLVKQDKTLINSIVEYYNNSNDV